MLAALAPRRFGKKVIWNMQSGQGLYQEMGNIRITVLPILNLRIATHAPSLILKKDLTSKWRGGLINLEEFKCSK